MADLTPSGFERRNRTEILEDVNSRFRTKFGQNVVLTEDSVMGKLSTLISELELEYEKLAEEVHSSQTLGGAEGIYLDDVLSKYGVFRRGKVAGSGVVHILYTIPLLGDGTSDDSVSLDSNYLISAQNGRTYSPSTTVTLRSNTSGLLIKRADLVNGREYQVSITNTNGDTFTSTAITFDGTDATAESLFNEIASLIATNTDNAIGSNIFVDGTDGSEVLYVGYSSPNEDSFIGLVTPIDVSFTKAAGQRWGASEVVCNTAGVFPVEIGEVTGIAPEPQNFQQITNTDQFNEGQDVETDAEYKARYFDVINSGVSGTREGIAGALRNLDNVDNVRIYDNPTEFYLTQNDSTGDITLEASDLSSGAYTTIAEPFTFNCVVNGGIASDIGNSIYENKPINVRTFGEDGPVTITTSDGSEEDIFYTEATQKGLNIKITYTSGDGIPLSSQEQTQIRDNIKELFTEFEIGDIVYNTQVVSAVLRNLTYSRVKDIVVEIKAKTDGSYLAPGQDYENLFYNEVAAIQQDNDIIIDRS